MNARVPRGIRDNLRFLVAEVESQVKNLGIYLKTGSPTVALRVLDRSGYAHNLKMRIHDSCISRLARGKEDAAGTLTLRALELIATDLDRITELCRECVRHMMSVERRKHLKPKAYRRLLNRIGQGIGMVESVVMESNTRLALELGRIEHELDKDYRKLLEAHTAALKRKKSTEDLISGLFIAHAIEQMGTALRRVSESIISANLGQPVHMERYQSIQASVARLESPEALDDLRVESIAETRSGSTISGISRPDGAGRGKRRRRGESEEYVAVYKDGPKRKLKEERAGVESWHEIYPGLAPRILSYHKRGQSAALLIEHLAGHTFERILLHEPPELLAKALERLSETLRSVWRETRTKKAVNARFMRQTAKRMAAVYAIHGELERGDSRVCGAKMAGFDTLLDRAERVEERLRAPFSVYIHGDFNVDNIIYDPLEKRIHFIDLHRSRYMDYVQDVSVFMVSNYRLQILDAPLRRRIMRLAREFYDFARKYAREEGDATFELRLALGLARSFTTSTRFILDKSLAQRMFLRARYLIEQVLAVDPKRAVDFRMPIQKIFLE
ncbi:MAG: phosphotransferase [bacterium]|nr:phosphotransferase [bacterium]